MNIDNFAMLKVIARNFCFTFVANIDDFDFAELLVIIFVEKAVDVEQNARGAHVVTIKSIHFHYVFKP